MEFFVTVLESLDDVSDDDADTWFVDFVLDSEINKYYYRYPWSGIPVVLFAKFQLEFSQPDILSTWKFK